MFYAGVKMHNMWESWDEVYSCEKHVRRCMRFWKSQQVVFPPVLSKLHSLTYAFGLFLGGGLFVKLEHFCSEMGKAIGEWLIHWKSALNCDVHSNWFSFSTREETNVADLSHFSGAYKKPKKMRTTRVGRLYVNATSRIGQVCEIARKI